MLLLRSLTSFGYCWGGKTVQDTGFGLFNYPQLQLLSQSVTGSFGLEIHLISYEEGKMTVHLNWIFRAKLHMSLNTEIMSVHMHTFPRYIFICTSIRHENYVEFQKLQKLQKTKPHNTVPEILRWLPKMWLQINKLKFNIKCILYFFKKRWIYQTKFLRVCC